MIQVCNAIYYIDQILFFKSALKVDCARLIVHTYGYNVCICTLERYNSIIINTLMVYWYLRSVQGAVFCVR